MVRGMDYIQHRLFKAIEKTKKRQDGKDSTIVGYYNVLIQYQLYLMFACVWEKREPELPRAKRMEYLSAMKRATLGTILNVIVELDLLGKPILGVDNRFKEQIMDFIRPRNTETAHGTLIPGIQEDRYKELTEKYENISKSIKTMDIPILTEDCKIYYMSSNESYQVTVFDNEDYDYQDLNEQLVKALDLQPGELYYYFDNVCYKISPFLILRELKNGENPYEIYCYQEYNLRNGKFEYKRYSELSDNSTYSKICKDYFLSFQKEFSHTISKANGVICNKFENNYDYFISTSPIDSYEQKIWQFIKNSKSNACLTIRGGGGIGKTALIQYVCTKNIFEPFDIGSIQYVIFCSAKDREFKQTSGLTGHIRTIQDESIVRCYEDIIRTISWVIDVETELKTEDDIKIVENAFINTSGALLIVDDFETLSQEDKKKVVALSSRLDVMKHKMIITTRSQYMVGEEYYITGLDQSQTISFMQERYKQQGCTEMQCKTFEQFVQNKELKKKIFELTKGLPMLAIQLGNILVFNGFNEKSLAKRDDEEVEDFLLGRLYSYFGTTTSEILFLIIAIFFQFGSDKVAYNDLQTMYNLLCERMNIVNIDYDQDLNELKKLNIIMVETDYIRISNYISNSIIRQCQDKLMSGEDIDFAVFDNLLFKNVIELGIKDGVLAYCEKENAQIDYAFVKVFVFDNSVKFTNDLRFSILEKYILKILDENNALRDLYRETCKYFDIPTVENKFVYYGKKHGFSIPEFSTKRDICFEKEISVDYYLEEIINELENQKDVIDDFLDKRKKGASQSFCLDTIQNIRGRLASICNVKLAKIFSLELEEYGLKLQSIKIILDEISYTKEFNVKENEQYVRLEELLSNISHT